MISARLVSRLLQALPLAVSDEDRATPPQHTQPADGQSTPTMRHLYHRLVRLTITTHHKATATVNTGHTEMVHMAVRKTAACQSSGM